MGLVFVSIGLAVALQGVWEIVRYLRGRRPEPEPVLPTTTFEFRLFVRFLRLLVGRYECAQIDSPALEQRIRTRYWPQTAELSRLGFRYLCSYGESFSAFRLPLLIPVLLILVELWHREIIRLKGARIQKCCPLVIAGDDSTFAEVYGLGVKFYTAFTDGTFLVSVNHESRNFEGPVMTKRWRVDGVSKIRAEHRNAIEQFEASGRQVDRRADFETFADMSRREGSLGAA